MNCFCKLYLRDMKYYFKITLLLFKNSIMILVVKKKKHMLSNQLIKIETRGNGSCGPNALGIIFCSYLLTDQYEQKRIDLRSFARIWNLFYCSNDPANPDYIRSVDSCDFKLAPSFLR